MRSSREFFCDSEWRTSASGTSSHHSCHSSDSTPRRNRLWASERCTGRQWLHTPGNPLDTPGPEHKTHTHTHRWHLLRLKWHKYQFQGQDGRTAAGLCGLSWRQTQWDITKRLFCCTAVTVHNQSGWKSLSNFSRLSYIHTRLPLTINIIRLPAWGALRRIFLSHM